MSTTTQPLNGSHSPPVLPKPPTNDQRVSIRSLLDQYFDDQKGYYLDGYSDHKVAEEVGVARAVVERIRESAYGPLLVDQELVTLQQEAAKLKSEFFEFKASTDKKLRELEASIASASSRIEKRVDHVR